MGYLTQFNLPQFKNDIFISYRRASNETHDKWVDVFCEALGSNLVELLGNVSIWRDTDRIVSGDAWRPELQAAVDGAAIFLAIVSRTYFGSDECRKELDRFLLRMNEGSGTKRKIVPVIKQPPYPDPPPPPEINALQRHEFYLRTPDPTRWRELRPDGSTDEQRDFWESLGRLAQDIMIALEERAREVTGRARGKIFVARVCPELEQQRERLRADVQQRGYLVVPRNEYFWNASDQRDAMAADLEDALLCVHLVTGRKSEDPHSVVHSRIQLDASHEKMKRKGGPPPLVWIQPSEGIDDSARELIEAIEGDMANDGVEYWRGSLEDLKTQIYDKLPAAAVEAPAPDASDVALVVEESDIGGIGPLRALLADTLELDLKLVKFSGCIPKDPERMKRALSTCRRCVIFWSGQPEEWLEDLFALPEIRAFASRGTMCVHIAGPQSTEKAVYRRANATVVDGTAGLAEDGWRAFFQVGRAHDGSIRIAARAQSFPGAALIPAGRSRCVLRTAAPDRRPVAPAR